MKIEAEIEEGEGSQDGVDFRVGEALPAIKYNSTSWSMEQKGI